MPDAQDDCLSLPPAAHAVRDGRQFVAQILHTWGLDELIEAAVLLTSEVLTNVVLHARTASLLAVSRAGDDVTVEVSDGSPVRPRIRPTGPQATTGRGLALLDQLASSWTVVATDTGKTLRFTLSGRVDPWAAFSFDSSFADTDL